MDFRAQREQDRVALVRSSRFDDVLLDVGHHLLGAVTSIGGAQKSGHETQVDALPTPHHCPVL